MIEIVVLSVVIVFLFGLILIQASNSKYDRNMLNLDQDLIEALEDQIKNLNDAYTHNKNITRLQEEIIEVLKDEIKMLKSDKLPETNAPENK